MPTATYRHQAQTPLSPAELWKRLHLAETWSSIGPVEQVWDARYDNGALAGFKWSTSVGHSKYQGSANATVVEDGSKMVLQLTTKELIGALTANISSVNNESSTLEITLAIESRGMLASLFFPAISQAVGSGLPGQVDAFVASLAG